MRRPLIVGNWKMHGDGEWLDRIAAIADAAAAAPMVDVAVCVPATLVHRAATRATTLAIGGQDCHWAREGAHTGAVSATMLHEAGARLVIVGHSERRAIGDDDRVVAAKVAAAQDAGLTAILCVGETAAERNAGSASTRVQAQVCAALPKSITSSLVVAYEPVWAIGRGSSPAASEITPVIDDIHTILAAAGHAQVPILYGGSVTAAIAGDILAHGAVSGLLVGTASLEPAAFASIIAAAGGHARLDRPNTGR